MATPRTPPPLDQDARGIVDPAQLQQMAQLTRYPVGQVLDGLVDRFWAVTWALPPGHEHVQAVLNHPGANLYVGVPEPGAPQSAGPVDGPLEGALEGPHRFVTRRRLAGKGWTVAAMTTPRGLGAFARVPARTLTDRTVPLHRPVLDVDGPALVAAVAAGASEPERVVALRAALEQVVETADVGRVAIALAQFQPALDRGGDLLPEEVVAVVHGPVRTEVEAVVHELTGVRVDLAHGVDAYDEVVADAFEDSVDHRVAEEGEQPGR